MPWLHDRSSSPLQASPLQFCHFNAAVDCNGEQRPPYKCDMTPYTAVEATGTATEVPNAKYSRWILCTQRRPLRWVNRWPRQNWKTVLCSLKAVNFIWPALNIWLVFLCWPFRIVKIKCAVFRPRKITGFQCSAMLIWQFSPRVGPYIRFNQ